MPLRLEHRGDEKCCRRTIFGVRLHRYGEECRQPWQQTGLSLGLLHTCANYQRIRLLDDFAPQHPLAREVMVDGRTCQIGADRDRLEGGGVVAEFAEDFASRLYDALTRFSSLRCGWATGSSARRMLRHGQIVPQVTSLSGRESKPGRIGWSISKLLAPCRAQVLPPALAIVLRGWGPIELGFSHGERRVAGVLFRGRPRRAVRSRLRR